MQLILTLSKIYSHLYVSLDRINEFCEVISLCEAEKHSLFEFLRCYRYNMAEYYYYIINLFSLQQETYSYKAFVYFFQKSCSYEAFIYRLRRDLIAFSLNDHLYSVIYNKLRIFYKDEYIIVIPDEPLCDRINRRLFTDEPPPFSFDFGIQNPTDKSINQMILKLCHYYGLPGGRQTFTQYSMVSHSSFGEEKFRILSLSKLSTSSGKRSNSGRRNEKSNSDISPCVKYKTSPTKHRVYPTVEESVSDTQLSINVKSK